jgi:hypothetical protein
VRVVLWAGPDAAAERHAVAGAVLPLLCARAAARGVRLAFHDALAALPAGQVRAVRIVRVRGD